MFLVFVSINLMLSYNTTKIVTNSTVPQAWTPMRINITPHCLDTMTHQNREFFTRCYTNGPQRRNISVCFMKFRTRVLFSSFIIKMIRFNNKVSPSHFIQSLSFRHEFNHNEFHPSEIVKTKRWIRQKDCWFIEGKGFSPPMAITISELIALSPRLPTALSCSPGYFIFNP